MRAIKRKASQSGFMSQFALASAELAKLRKVFPSAFDSSGRPLVAKLTFPAARNAKNL